MSVILGTLVIDLKANTASFTQSMDKMSKLSGKTANDVKRSLEKIAAAGIAMGVAVAGGLATMIKSSVEAAHKLDILSQSAGTTADRLSAIGYAAKFSGVDTESLAGALEKLSKSSLSAQTGNTKLQNAFKLLGVNVESSKGHLKDSGQLYEELAPKFSKMADGAGKTALAMLVFGKSGAAQIPVLNQLGESNGKLTEEARKLGLVIGGDTARAATLAKENWEKLEGVVTGIGNAVTAVALPALIKVGSQLVDVAKAANIPDLGKAFGGTVVTAIQAVGTAMEFAVVHAHALKIAMEALLTLQVAKFAIPFGLELLTSGTLVAGVGKLITSVLGVGKLYPVLSQFSSWAAVTTSGIRMMIAGEGLAATASFSLSAGLAAIGGPITLVIAAIGGLVAVCYAFRASTFSLGGTTYELRDIWNAAWISMGKVFSWIGGQFQKLVGVLKGLWNGFTEVLANNIIVRIFVATFTTLLAWAQKLLGALTPQFIVDALNQAKSQREAADRPASSKPVGGAGKSGGGAETPNTGSLEAPKKDIYGEEIKKLDLAIAAQRAFLAVIGATPEKIANVASAERADAIILEKNNQLIDSQRAKLTAHQEATIRQKVAIEDATKAMVEYGRAVIVDQHSTDLSIQQTQRMTIASAGGVEATRKAGVENAILALTYGKTAEEVSTMDVALKQLALLLGKKADAEGLAEFTKSVDDQQRSLRLAIVQTEALAGAQLLGESAVRAAAEANAALGVTYGKTAEEVRKLAVETGQLADLQGKKAAADRLDASNTALFGLQQDLAGRAGLPAAILAGDEAYRKALLSQKLYGIDQKILAEENQKVKTSLMAQRQEIINLTKAEEDEGDARKALALQSTSDKYKEEVHLLNDEIDALTEGGKRALTYGESQQVAARQQEILNRAIDNQVKLLNQTGGARDGVKAFFLDMQKQAKTTGAVVFDALNSAFTKLSDNITNLITGSKTNFAQAFRDVGKQIVGDQVKAGLQRGLGAVGKALGVEIPKGKPDGSADNPFWIRTKGGGALPGLGIPGVGGANTGPAGGSDGFFSKILGQFGGGKGATESTGSAQGGGGFSAILGSLFKGFFGGGMAGGGVMSPDKAYMVGEHGREIVKGANARVMNNSQTERLMQPSGSTHYYNIDARGTDPVLTEQRTRQAILSAHNSAIASGVKVQQEHVRRTPQRQ